MGRYYIHVDEINGKNEEYLNKLGVTIDGKYDSISVYAVIFEENQLEKIQELPFVSNVEKQGLDKTIIDEDFS